MAFSENLRIVDRVNRRIEAECKLLKDTQKKRSRKLKELQREIDRLVDMVARGVATREAEDRIVARTADRDRLQAIEDMKPLHPIDADDLRRLSEEAIEARDGDDIELRWQVIRKWVERILVDPVERKIELTLQNSTASSISRLMVGGANGSRTVGEKTCVIQWNGRGKLKLIAA
jgi:hypothetical protein